MEIWKQQLSHEERIFKIKLCRTTQKFSMTLLAVKILIMTSRDLDTIRNKMDQTPKQQNKKHTQKVMQKQSKRIGRLHGHSSTEKIQILESTTNKNR